MTAEVRVVSYGGGVQSTALLVLAAQGRIDFDSFLFANTGDDSEDPRSLRYVREIATPWAAERGIEVVELHRVPTRGRHAGTCDPVTSTSDLPYSGGRRWLHQCSTCTVTMMLDDPVAQFPEHRSVETLYGRLMHPDSRSVGIPVRLASGAPGNRSCTVDFKIKVVAKELKRRGATPDAPATVALGISTDEIQRARPGRDDREPVQFRVYPLLDLGIDRNECKRIIAAAGLPVPPKSSCYFCPYHSIETWRELRNDRPDLFERSQLLEDTLNERRSRLACPGVGTYPPEAHRSEWHCEAHGTDCPDPLECDAYTYEHPVLDLDAYAAARRPIISCSGCSRQFPPEPDGRLPWHGKDPVWLTDRMLRLSDTVDDQLSFDGMGDDCDSGYCFT